MLFNQAGTGEAIAGRVVETPSACTEETANDRKV